MLLSKRLETCLRLIDTKPEMISQYRLESLIVQWHKDTVVQKQIKYLPRSEGRRILAQSECRELKQIRRQIYPVFQVWNLKSITGKLVTFSSTLISLKANDTDEINEVVDGLNQIWRQIGSEYVHELDTYTIELAGPGFTPIRCFVDELVETLMDLGVA